MKLIRNLLKRKQNYISVIIKDHVDVFLLKKESNQYQLVAREQLSLDTAGIIDGHLGNPSFFAYVLYSFFKKHAIKNLYISLSIPHNDTANSIQYKLYCEYFRFSLVNLVSVDTLDTNTDCARYAQALWQGE
jgi:Tfp pilus assembly PilM family ATPase